MAGSGGGGGDAGGEAEAAAVVAVAEGQVAVGGRLSLGPAEAPGSKAPGRGFRLTATVPAQTQPPAAHVSSSATLGNAATAAWPGTGDTYLL